MTFFGLECDFSAIFQGFYPLSKFHFLACTTLVTTHLFYFYDFTLIVKIKKVRHDFLQISIQI